MRRSFEAGFTAGRQVEHTRIACTWCDEGVPLPEGDETGVCIECGAVAFRNQMAQMRMRPERGAAPDICDFPAPA